MATGSSPRRGHLARLAAYRVAQAVGGSFGRLDEGAAARAVAELPPNLRPLFLSMRARDQRHALGVLQRVGAASEVLRQAALLHDVGKAQVYLGTAGRTLVVVAGATGTTALVCRLPGVGPRIARYLQHPQVGADMLRAAGASPDLVEIVSEHQDPHPRRPETLLLQAADGRE